MLKTLSLLVAFLATVTTLQANQVMFRLAAGEGHFSDSTTPISVTEFSFQLGTFKEGFQPTASNTSQWEANFLTGPENDVQTGLQNAVSEWWTYDGYPDYGRSAFETIIRPGAGPNGEIVEGDQIYIWGYNSKDLSGVAEWILLTNANWTFPEPTSFGELFLPPEDWVRTTDSGTLAIVGSINHPDYPNDVHQRALQTASVGADGSMPASSGSADGGGTTLVAESDEETKSSSDTTVSGGDSLAVDSSTDGFSLDAACMPLGEEYFLKPAYSEWEWDAAFAFDDGSYPGQYGYNDDPFGDGVPLLLSYFLGLDPTQDNRPCVPRAVFKQHKGETYLAITFLQPKWIEGVRYKLAASSDLFSWSEICGAVVLREDLPAGYPEHYEQVWMLDEVPMDFFPRRFLRLHLIHSAELQYADSGHGWPLAERLVADAPGLVIEDVRYTGYVGASDCFSDGLASGLDFDEGIVLTSGWASEWNRRTVAARRQLVLPGDTQLDNWMENQSWEAGKTWAAKSADTSVLEIDFIPDHNRISLRFLFASEEYYWPEAPLNDAMAIFLGRYENGAVNWTLAGADGGNIGVLPETYPGDQLDTTDHRGVAVYNIGEVPNHFEPLSNYPDWFINNSSLEDDHDPPNPDAPPFDVTYSGFTVAFDAVGEVEAGKSHILRIVMADGGDEDWDAAAFLEAGSFGSYQED